MAINLKEPTALYHQIADDLRSQIESGKLKVGEQLGSQHELAQEYGVSLITVKKALLTLINERILFSRVGKGTYVARKFAPMRFSQQKSIGLVLRDLRSPFFSLIVHGAEEAASEQGYSIILSNSSGHPEKEEAQIRHFRRIGVNGLMIASMSHVYHPTPIIRTLLKEDFPLVMISYVEDEDVPFVGTDHELGGYLATTHLIKLGYQNIGYINGEKGNLVGEERRKGYLRALRAADIQVREELIFRLRWKGEWNDFRSGAEMGEKFMKLKTKPDAVFVYNDLAALGFQEAVRKHGQRVPDDIAIVGFDDIERSAYADVPLTTVRQPTPEIGRKAIEALLQKISGARPPIRSALKPTLVIRESCGAARRWMSNKKIFLPLLIYLVYPVFSLHRLML